MNQKDIKRKLSCILSADVVGYSRLMEEDEASTVQNLEDNKTLISELVKEYNGRVVDAPGDNLLAEFNSVVKAVDCAVKIQKELKIKNNELLEHRRMYFRIGINLGDVIEEGDRIYGSGVNIAARVEGLALTGGICISGTAYDHVKTKYDLGYEYLGEHKVKNINEPVRIYRIHMSSDAVTTLEPKKKVSLRTWRRVLLGFFVIFMFGFIVWNFYYRQTPLFLDKEESAKTIAVLPFVDLSPERNQGYFVDGLSEEILNSLTQLPRVYVIGRTSSFSFKDSGKTIQDIAGILGADHILEGSVRKEGNELRINAQLLRATDGVRLWSKTYDRELKGIFTVQEDIASTVANELKVTLGIEQPLKHISTTNNPEAYELYLIAKGQYNDNKYKRALESVNSAIKLDPEFATVWALKGMVHIFLSSSGPDDQAHFEHKAALEAALRAIELEPNLGKAYLTLGSAHMMMGKFIEAEVAYRKGIELTTESIDYFEYGLTWHYAVVGYLKKCNELLREMRQKDPLQPVLRTAYMFNLGNLGDIEQAEEEYKRGKAIFGDQQYLANARITMLRLGSQNDISIDKIPEVPMYDPIWIKFRKFVESPKEGLAELRRLYTSDDNLSSNDFNAIAIWAAYFGDPDIALDGMERSVRLHATSLHDYWTPLFHEARQLPRFKKFVKEIGLVDYWNKYGWPDLCNLTGDGDFECN